MRIRTAGPTLAVVLACVAASSPARAEIAFYNIFKTIAYSQTSDAAPATPAFYFGTASVASNNSTDLTGATVSIPTAANLTLTGSGGFYSTFTPGNTKAELDAALPNGNQASFTLNGGTLNGSVGLLNIPASDQYTTAIPYFTGSTYSTLQNFNAANAITLNFGAFNPFSGLVTDATTFIDISQVGGPSVFSDQGVNTLTSTTVAGGTLQAGTTYDLSLVYSDRIVEQGGFPGSFAFTGYDVRVDLIFTTADAAAVPEPSSLALCGVAAGFGWAVARLRRSR